jgi:hypothetical protein
MPIGKREGPRDPVHLAKQVFFKLAKAGRIPSFRIGTCVRFDPRPVAQWLRERMGVA